MQYRVLASLFPRGWSNFGCVNGLQTGGIEEVNKKKKGKTPGAPRDIRIYWGALVRWVNGCERSWDSDTFGFLVGLVNTRFWIFHARYRFRFGWELRTANCELGTGLDLVFDAETHCNAFNCKLRQAAHSNPNTETETKSESQFLEEVPYHCQQFVRQMEQLVRADYELVWAPLSSLRRVRAQVQVQSIAKSPK